MSEPLTLARINALDETGFVDALGFAFEHSPWVVRRAWGARPFASHEALHAAMTAAVTAAAPAEQLALIPSDTPEAKARSSQLETDLRKLMTD